MRKTHCDIKFDNFFSKEETGGRHKPPPGFFFIDKAIVRYTNKFALPKADIESGLARRTAKATDRLFYL